LVNNLNQPLTKADHPRKTCNIPETSEVLVTEYSFEPKNS